MELPVDPNGEIPFPELIEGAELNIVFRPPGLSPLPERLLLPCKVIKVYRPFTMSAVFHVSIKPSSTLQLPAEAVVKLYDRRAISNTRIYFDNKPWSLNKDRLYWRYADNAARGVVLPGNFEDIYYLDGDVTEGEFEAYLKYKADKKFDIERAVYERLKELQGQNIPKLYGSVEYEITTQNARDDGSSVTETIPGLLLEYISDLTLREFVETWTKREPALPNDVLISICEAAVKVVHLVSDFDVLNMDARPSNFLVREPFVAASSSSSYGEPLTKAIVQIDFNSCRLRREGESDEEWRRAKWARDEFGAVGYVLSGLIRNSVGKDIWPYERDMRYCPPSGVDEEYFIPYN